MESWVSENKIQGPTGSVNRKPRNRSDPIIFANTLVTPWFAHNAHSALFDIHSCVLLLSSNLKKKNITLERGWPTKSFLYPDMIRRDAHNNALAELGLVKQNQWDIAERAYQSSGRFPSIYSKGFWIESRRV